MSIASTVFEVMVAVAGGLLVIGAAILALFVALSAVLGWAKT